MFRKVDLPHWPGPSSTRNSLSDTARLMSRNTSVTVPPAPGKGFQNMLGNDFSGYIAISRFHGQILFSR